MQIILIVNCNMLCGSEKKLKKSFYLHYIKRHFLIVRFDAIFLLFCNKLSPAIAEAVLFFPRDFFSGCTCNAPSIVLPSLGAGVPMSDENRPLFF